ncbi:TonB-dependent receptor [Sphingomonas alpina]|uniref:TonB-dependent receptor n=1 Tax=Sphingomonas alpina TaxID=653931 RepID=A0A7H0LKM9_9SPHN|nr:TonB-dependent receptor [Sphingomonas alpina]QNQ10232.1 TonB-dependent receptor [Sphingomonas alpina]
MIAATSAEAGERHNVNISAIQLDQAIILLGRQTGASIGLRDRRIATLKVRAVNGKVDAAQALAKMLRDSGAMARQVAPGVFIIEAAARPALRPKLQSRPAPLPEPPEATQDIIVTAAKYDRRLRDLPGMAAVIQGRSLSFAESALGSDAIEGRVASVASTHLGAGRNKLFIRGVADSSFTGPTQSTVGQYWGDTRINYSAPDPSLRLYDVRSVEVLEGPQGTLYGAGSLGGIIRIVPEAPNMELASARAWSGLSVTQDGKPGGDIGGIINLPVKGDTLALRGLAYGGIDGGYIDDRQRGLKDVNRVETIGGRATLRFSPSQDWTIDLSGNYQRIAGDDAQYADRHDLTRSSALAQPYRNEYLLGELVIAKDLGVARLVSSTGIVDQYVAERFDATPPGELARAYDQISRIRMVSSETRLSHSGANGDGWVIGVSALSTITRQDRTFDQQFVAMGGVGEVAIIDRLPTFPVASPAGLVTVPFLTSGVVGVRNRVDEATLYGEATVAPLPWLSLTGGGRLTHSRLSGRALDRPEDLAFRLDQEAQGQRTETRFLPSIAVSLRPADRVTAFLRYQQGYRPGGLSVGTNIVQYYKGDEVETAEVGLRYIGVGRFDISLTFAHTRWRDIQADLIDESGFPITANIGDGRITSAGISAHWQPLPRLDLQAALYLNSSEVTTPTAALVAAYAADRTESAQPHAAKRAGPSLPNVADASGLFRARYSAPVGRVGYFTFDAYARYVGQSRLGIGPVLGRPQGDTLDTGIEFRIGGERRGLTLSLTNLLNEEGNRFALGSPFLMNGSNQITPLRPRSIRIGFDASF